MTTASCGLMYGPLNSWKTTQAGRIARYLYETFGLTSRMPTADNEYDTVKDLVDAGVIDVLSLKGFTNIFAVLTKLSQGFWPVIRNGKMVMAPTPPEKMAKIGAYLNEGTTTIAELCHADHINKARKIGENIVGQFDDTVETDTGVETISYGKSAQAHYQHVQDFVTYNLIPGFGSLPVKWIWWTGHEYMGEDEATGRSMLGPGVIGKAACMKVPRVVGNTFHMVVNEEVTTNPQTHKTTRTLTHRAYFEKHKDANLVGQYWPAGLKIPPGAQGYFLDMWKERFPDGYIELTKDQGVEEYVKFHQEIAKRAQKLVITPGTEVYVDAKVKEPQAAPFTSAALPSIGTASQTKPPLRSSGTLIPKPPLPFKRYSTVVPPKPTLEEQLQKSVEMAQQQKVAGVKLTQDSPVPIEGTVELPDINAVPASTTSSASSTEATQTDKGEQ